MACGVGARTAAAIVRSLQHYCFKRASGFRGGQASPWSLGSGEFFKVEEVWNKEDKRACTRRDGVGDLTTAGAMMSLWRANQLWPFVSCAGRTCGYSGPLGACGLAFSTRPARDLELGDSEHVKANACLQHKSAVRAETCIRQRCMTRDARK